MMIDQPDSGETRPVDAGEDAVLQVGDGSVAAANMPDLHPAIREAMTKLVVTAGTDEKHGPYLLVDASAVMADDADVALWLLFPEDDGQWSHGPSGTVAPLGAALWSIAGCYVLVPDPGAES